jgi:hypothetical protein
MSDAFAPTVRARPNPIFGRPVQQRSPPCDYSPILLLKPFGLRITPDTLSSSEQTRWPTRHYPTIDAAPGPNQISRETPRDPAEDEEDEDEEEDDRADEPPIVREPDED